MSTALAILEAPSLPATVIAAEMEAARDFALNEKSEATRRAYRGDFSAFSTWCRARGLVALPASTDTVAAFLAAQANAGAKASSIGRRCASIRYAHRLSGHEPPTNAESVKAVMRGIRRTIGTAKEQKAPATADRIAAMLAGIPTDTLTGLRDRAPGCAVQDGPIREEAERKLLEYYRQADIDGREMILRAARGLQHDVGPVTSTEPVGPATITEPAAGDILSLCAAFDALHRRKVLLFDAMPDGYERECAVDAVELQQAPLVYRLAELRATNMEEHRARARSLALYLGKDQLLEDADSSLWPNRMTAAILRDLAAVSDADTALLDLCHQFDIASRTLQRHDGLSAERRTLELDDSALDTLLERWDDMLGQITALSASTSEGRRAKAGALRHALAQKVMVESHRSFEEQAEDYELLAMSLAFDLDGAGAPAVSFR